MLALTVKVPSLWPTATWPEKGLIATALEHYESGYVVKEEAPLLLSDLATVLTVP